MFETQEPKGALYSFYSHSATVCTCLSIQLTVYQY